MGNYEMNDAEEWIFRFGLINQEGETVSYEKAEALMETIILWAEERDYGVGGGFRRGPDGDANDEAEVFPLRED